MDAVGNGSQAPLSPGRKDRRVDPIGACLVVFGLLFVGFTFGLMWGAILWR